MVESSEPKKVVGSYSRTPICRRQFAVVDTPPKQWSFPASCCTTYPTTNGGMQNGSSVEIYTQKRITCFLHVWHRFVCSVGAYQQNFWIRAQVGSLLRVRCWLGSGSCLHTPCPSSTVLFFLSLPWRKISTDVYSPTLLQFGSRSLLPFLLLWLLQQEKLKPLSALNFPIWGGKRRNVYISGWLLPCGNRTLLPGKGGNFFFFHSGFSWEEKKIVWQQHLEAVFPKLTGRKGWDVSSQLATGQSTSSCVGKKTCFQSIIILEEGKHKKCMHGKGEEVPRPPLPLPLSRRPHPLPWLVKRERERKAFLLLLLLLLLPTLERVSRGWRKNEEGRTGKKNFLHTECPD